MSLTNFPNGLTSFGIPLPAGIPFGKNSKAIFVAPGSGSDGRRGTSPDQAVATLSRALALATADSNDVVYMISEDNSASGTTDYQSSALDWNKDGVHLIGVNSGNGIQNRSRIAQLSTATNVDDLFTVSASNCMIANISVFHGVDDATSKGAVKVSGERNYFYNCTMSGIGNATMDTADNYSLNVTGSENTFERCYIGLDTVARGTAATYEMALQSGATRNRFLSCQVVSYAEDAGFAWVYVPTNGIDRWNLFDNTLFINMPTGDASGTTMTEGFDVTGGGSPDGLVLLRNCGFVGAATIEADTVSGKVMVINNGAADADAGLAIDAT